MNILIDDAGFINKGAELMFCSVAEQIKNKYPDAQILIPNYLYNSGGYEYCTENNIKPMKGGFTAYLLLKFYKLCVKKGLLSEDSPRLFVHSKEVDVVLDAGGFRFGDQWKHNARHTKNIKKFYNSFKKGYKLVFLPQSFGPFENIDSSNTVNAALKHSGLVYAREEISMNYLQKIANPNLNIKFKRDFTILHKNKTFLSPLLDNREYVLFIPNKKMITHSNENQNSYVDFMCKLLKEFLDRGETVYLLNHEGFGDKEICEQIKKRLNFDIPIFSGLRAMQVKNIIGNAKFVVSSRFHGVVSGIVQRVPTFCTSWSHKYNELLSVYGLEKNLLDLTSVDKAIEKIGDSLVNPENYIAKQEVLDAEKVSIKEMWNEIFEYLDK